MKAKDNLRTAAEVLVDQLIVNGVKHAFCVPGESYLAVLDAFHDRDIAVTVCRHESGAAMMAEAVGKVTGRPGICFVTRGPGATNASAGIHIAQQDSSPMIVFVGQVAREMREREAFQELDYRAVFGTMTKWATEIDDPARVPEIVSRAFHIATSGRPGPVVIALPEDMLVERVAVGDVAPARPIETSPGGAEMAELADLVAKAERPVFILGGSRWSEAGVAAIASFAEKFAMPIATSFRRAHLIHPLHPCYAGDLGIGPNPKLLARIKAADLVVLVGGRLGEMPSQGYTLFDIPTPQMTFVHVHPGVEELGRVYRPHLAINATPAAFALAADKLAATQRIRGGAPRPRPPTTSTSPSATSRRRCPATSISARSWSGCATISPTIPSCATAPAISPAGFTASTASASSSRSSRRWRDRWATASRRRSRMKRLYPERTSVAVCGDGDFLMTGQDFATAVQFELRGDRDHRRQRPLRHHPHAPGARISRPHLRDRDCAIPISPPMPRRSAASG